MSELKYCAGTNEAIEFVADTEQEVKNWIDKNTFEETPEIHYRILTKTQAELDALLEV